jgi:hypothetical protein
MTTAPAFNIDGSPLYTLTFKVGRRTVSMQRYEASPDAAKASADRIAAEWPRDGVKVVSVVLA